MSLIPTFYDNSHRSIFDPFFSNIWDPFRDFPYSSSKSSFSLPRETFTFANACVDWRETQDAHVFMVDILSLKKEEVKFEVKDDRILQISGERSMEKEDTNHTWHRVERSSGKFMRRFKLLESVKLDEIKASMEHGVLTVTVPKKEVKK